LRVFGKFFFDLSSLPSGFIIRGSGEAQFGFLLVEVRCTVGVLAVASAEVYVLRVSSIGNRPFFVVSGFLQKIARSFLLSKVYLAIIVVAAGP